MKAYIIIVLFFFLCLSVQTLKANNFNVLCLELSHPIQHDDTVTIFLKKLNCKILDIRFYDSGKRILDIKKNKEHYQIKILSPEDYPGFSVNWIKDIGNGFEVSIEYGTRYYYQKDLQFIYKDSTFFLKRIKVSTFDKFNPAKYSKYTQNLVNPIRVIFFKLENFVKSEKR